MPRPFQPDDICLHRHITAVDVHAARRLAVCAVQSVDRAGETYTAALWLAPLEGDDALPGGGPRPLTAGTARDDQPCWSPDGSRIAFLSDRGGDAPQVHLISPDGGEAHRIGHFDKGAGSLRWRPDGRALLVTAPVPVDPNDRGGRPSPDLPPRAADAPELAWRLPYKLDGAGYVLDREQHLFCLDIDSGDCVQLTDGAFDVKGAAWSPDGQRIAYARTREGAAHCTDIWVMDADGRHPRRLSTEQPTASGPGWSPDGAHIVFGSSLDEGDAQPRLWRIELASGQVSSLGEPDVEVVVSDGPVTWSEDGERFAFVIAHRGLRQIAWIALRDGRLERLDGGLRHVDQIAGTPQHLVYSAASPAVAQALYVCCRDGSGERCIARFNDWWDERQPLDLQQRRFTVPDGLGGSEPIEGWLLLPRERRPGQAMPLLVDVHGGPASYVLLDYVSRAYWQVLCSQGWAVLALNAVGSSSYGRAFTARLRGHWGEYDLPQHLAAVKALQDEGLADERVAIAGKSYGGYLSAWAIGHSDVFRAAVVAAPVANLEAHFGTSDSGYCSDPYALCGEPYIDRETSRRLSPAQFIDRATTPTLFLQGKADERCPLGQSEELFVTLVRAGRTPTEMVLYPGGDHHFYEQGKPSHRIDAIERVVDWLTRWIDRSPEAAEAPRAGPALHGRTDQGHDARA